MINTVCDVRVEHLGSIVLFHANSVKAEEWLVENVEDGLGLRCGHALVFAARAAEAIIEGLRAEGFEVSA